MHVCIFSTRKENVWSSGWFPHRCHGLTSDTPGVAGCQVNRPPTPRRGLMMVVGGGGNTMTTTTSGRGNSLGRYYARADGWGSRVKQPPNICIWISEIFLCGILISTISFRLYRASCSIDPYLSTLTYTSNIN